MPSAEQLLQDIAWLKSLATRLANGGTMAWRLPGDDKADYAWIIELGGFHVSRSGSVDEITRRYGPGSYRITAYGFDPPGVRWELLIEDLA
jgi:hypothetical protein